jgi:hypothetical protein
MEIDEAIEIIKSVAEGTNPFTGEIFGENSVYQHPQMVRALYRALNSLEARKRWEKRQRDLPENAGKPWDKEEIDRLLSAFEAHVSMREIARTHKRTVGAIEARLVELGKIEPKDEKYRRG